MSKKNIVFDATTFTALQSCARLHDFRYNLNLAPKGGKSNSLEVGSVVHIVLEHYYKGLIQGLKRETAIANGLAFGELMIRGCKYCSVFEPSDEFPVPICGHKPNQFPGLQNTPMDSTMNPNRTGWKHALETCEQYFDYYRSDSWIPLEVEVVKGKVLYEDDEIRILWKAKLDLLTDTLQAILPVDHKTMRQRRDTNSLNNQFIGQCLVTNSRNVVINKIGFQTSLKPNEKFVREVISYSADRLLEFQGETLPYYAYQLLTFVEAGYWPPRFDHCENKYGNCVFKEVCESDRGMREEVLRNEFEKVEEWNPMNQEE
jgi:hypothetical protein